MSRKILFSNIIINTDVPIKVNQYFSFYKENGKCYLEWIDSPLGIIENTPSIFVQALRIALPSIHIYPKTVGEKCIIDTFSSCIIDYFSVEKEKDIVRDYTIQIEDNIEEIIETYNKLMVHHMKLHKKQQNDYIDFWNVALNKYLEACDCVSAERGIESLISCLETLVVNASSEISYKTSIFAALIYCISKEDRIATYDFIKNMYNVRSKVVHGDITSIKKYISTNRIFDDYLRLKEIVSRILIKMYQKEKSSFLKNIQESIFTVQLIEK